MIEWGERSLRNIHTLSEELQALCFDFAANAPPVLDCTIIWGYRGKKDQEAFYAAGTGLPWPRSYHNREPSDALDFVPYPFRADTWAESHRFGSIAGFWMALAQRRRLVVTWGGTWKSLDLGHVQLERNR